MMFVCRCCCKATVVIIGFLLATFFIEILNYKGIHLQYDMYSFKDRLVTKSLPEEKLVFKPKTFLTLFTTWERESDKFMCRNNTLNNWNSLGHGVVRVLFTNDSVSSKSVETSGWKTLPVRKASNTGVPVLRTMFEDVMRLADSDYYGYANGDILFTDDLIKTLHVISKSELSAHDDLLVMGQRIDVCFVTKFEADNQDALRQAAVTRGKIRSPYKIDYYVVKRGYPFHDFPDLVIGRPYVDSYLISHAKKFGHLIDITNSSLAAHQVTKYGREGTNEGFYNLDRKYNEDLLASKHIKYNFGSVFDATHYTYYSSSQKNIILEKISKQRKSYGDNFLCPRNKLFS